MAYYYLRKNCFWVSYQKGNQRVRMALKTADGFPVKDEKVAKYLINEIENNLIRSHDPAEIAVYAFDDIIPKYIKSIDGTIGPQQFNEECKQLKKFSRSIGNKILKEISPEDIKIFLDRLFKTVRNKQLPITDRTWNGYLVTLKKIFNFLVRENLLIKNPTLNISQRKLPRNPPFWFSNGKDMQLLKFTKKNSPSYYAPSAAGIYAGLRIAEMMNLEWSDITWSARKRKGFISVQNKMVWRTKNRTYRHIPMSEDLEKILLPLRKAKGFCFWPDDHSRHDYKKHRDLFKRICKDAGIPLPKGKAFHALRHTFGTKHGRAGRTSLKLAEWMGHSDVNTTRIYTHPDPHDKEIDHV